MHIFHIPSGFPTRHEQVSGISARDFIHAFAEKYPDVKHTVGLFYDTTYHLIFKNGKVITELPKYIFRKKRIELVQLTGNLSYCHAAKSLVYSPRLGYNVKSNWLRSYRGVLKFVIENIGKPALIHAQFTRFAGWTAWKLSKEFSIPYIITERFGPFPSPLFLEKGIEKLIDDIYIPMKNAAALVSVSEAHANDIRKYVDREVLVIPNLIDMDLFLSVKRKEQDDGFVFVTITSSYQANKGIDDLLKAIKIFKDRGGDAKFRIGGGENDADFKKLRQLSIDLQLNDCIQWVGKMNRNEIVELLQSSNCFISPSIYESFGLVCAEAIACGKPVIATRSGGAESIVNEINGVLVNIKEPEMIADAMSKMIQNRDQYNPEIIRKNCSDRFSANTITNQYYQVYNKVINQL